MCRQRRTAVTEKRVSRIEAKQIQASVLPDAHVPSDLVTIDPAVLALLKALPVAEDNASFEERVAFYTERIGSNLKAVRATLVAKDFRKLEGLACELSTNALMVGAVRILSSSYELQNAARLGDGTIAETLADQLDMEFLWAQDGLKDAAALK